MPHPIADSYRGAWAQSSETGCVWLTPEGSLELKAYVTLLGFGEPFRRAMQLSPFSGTEICNKFNGPCQSEPVTVMPWMSQLSGPLVPLLCSNRSISMVLLSKTRDGDKENVWVTIAPFAHSGAPEPLGQTPPGDASVVLDGFRQIETAPAILAWSSV